MKVEVKEVVWFLSILVQVSPGCFVLIHEITHYNLKIGFPLMWFLYFYNKVPKNMYFMTCHSCIVVSISLSS